MSDSLARARLAAAALGLGAAAVLGAAPPLHAQDSLPPAPADTVPADTLTEPLLPDDEGGGLRLGVGGAGLAIGDVPRWTGVRINWRDERLRRIDGINVNLWHPHGDGVGTVNGIALSPVAPVVARIHGAGAGLVGVVTSDRATGLIVGGLGVVADGPVGGVTMGGLGVVAGSDANGITLGGLGVVSDGRIRGVAVAGLGSVAQWGVTGAQVAGLGSVATGTVTGIQVAGLGAIAGSDLTGISIGGLAAISNGSARGLMVGGLGTIIGLNMDGIAVAGLGLVAGGRLTGAGATLGYLRAHESIRGVALGGYRVRSESAQGMTGAVFRVQLEELTGFSAAAWNDLGVQRGLVIGIFNRARELHGVQIGLLNYAGNNRGMARLLPLVNAHF
jgi:hypothetical protein